MAPEKPEKERDERPAASIKRTSEAQERPILRDPEAAGSELTTGQRRERWIIGTRTAPDGQPLGYTPSMEDVGRYLGRQENVEIVRRIKLGGTQPFTADGRSASEVIVARIDEDKAQWLRAVAPPQLIIERDSLLACSDYVPAPGRPMPIGTLLPLCSETTDVTIRVIGERDQPLARATVVIAGSGLPVQAITDESGIARMTFFGGGLETIQMLFIRSVSNHWDRLIAAPRLSSGTNTVRLRALSELYPNFPNERLRGWGLRLMGIEPAAGRFTGDGVRIGVIDSGCDNTHPQLRHITRGKDFTSGAADTAWTQDPISHGTHCAGILAASGTGQGIVGCSPAAELHVLKVIPGGRLSDLLAAVDECIQRGLDLINLSVVTQPFSELLAQKLQEARAKGIACIVAAGNTGGLASFPATLPAVLPVAAVGKLKEFPADSSHAQSIGPQLIGTDGIFAANFSGVGPQAAICAPGVAVVSTVPGGAYAAADGTSAAAAHVTGFAALLLAHHPLFQEEPYRVRSGERVHALFELIRASAIPRLSTDPMRGVSGIPDLSRVPGGQEFLERALADGAHGLGVVPPVYWPQPGRPWAPWLTLMEGATPRMFSY